MKYRGHWDYQEINDAIEVEANSRRDAAEKICQLIDAEFFRDDEIPKSRLITVWPREREMPELEYYDRRRDFIVTARIAYFAVPKDELNEP